MKKVNESLPHLTADGDAPDDDLLPHYEFKGGIRGKYAPQMQPGMEIVVNGERFIIQADHTLKPLIRRGAGS